MALRHPKGPPRSGADDIGVAPLFTLEAGKIPRHRLPEGFLRTWPTRSSTTS